MIQLTESHARILAPVSTLDYFDSQSADLPRHVSPLEAWNAMISQPRPLLGIAFKIRDSVSSLFGVRRIGGFSGQTTNAINTGDRLDFFLVEYVDENALVLTERDRHLDMMTCISTQDCSVTVTSSVRVHNRFGRAYMIPVGIAHRFIVRGILRQMRRGMAPRA